MIAAMGAGNSLFVIVGSWFADRVFGARNALVVGNIVKAIAFGLFAIPPVSLAQGRVFAVIGLVLMALPIMGASTYFMPLAPGFKISISTCLCCQSWKRKPAELCRKWPKKTQVK